MLRQFCSTFATVNNWFAEFCHNRTSTNNESPPRRAQEAVTPENMTKIKIKYELVNIIGLSNERVSHTGDNLKACWDKFTLNCANIEE